MNASDRDALFVHYDRDGDGFLSVDEFKQFLQDVLNKLVPHDLVHHEQPPEVVRSAFDMLTLFLTEDPTGGVVSVLTSKERRQSLSRDDFTTALSRASQWLAVPEHHVLEAFLRQNSAATTFSPQSWEVLNSLPQLWVHLRDRFERLLPPPPPLPWPSPSTFPEQTKWRAVPNSGGGDCLFRALSQAWNAYKPFYDNKSGESGDVGGEGDHCAVRQEVCDQLQRDRSILRTNLGLSAECIQGWGTVASAAEYVRAMRTEG